MLVRRRAFSIYLLVRKRYAGGVHMETNFENQVKKLREATKEIIGHFSKRRARGEQVKFTISEDYQREFFSLVDKVNLGLMEDKDNFYGYFLFQMSREIRFDISSPTAVNFKGAKYVIFFNPILYLKLDIKQMESTIKHEILHIVSMHLAREKELRGRFSGLVINMAMDIVVNKYLDYLPPYATTLEYINLKYNLELEPYQSFEYYAQKLQIAIDLLDDEENAPEDDREDNENAHDKEEQIETEYSAEKTHDLWEESSDIEEKTLQEFTEKLVSSAEKGEIPSYLNNIITSMKNSRGELPWDLYLHRLMGTLESNRKKTITRRSRRQPDRLELRGELRDHKANIAVALDISGSISDEEFKQAMKEVLGIVKNYNHEITVIECDSIIRRVYKVKSVKDIKDRINHKGGTKFNPVFEYINHHKVDLLVYFTDGKGEDYLKVIPRGYRVLWIISGRGDQLSLKRPYGAVKKLSSIEIKEDILDMHDVPRGGYSMNYQERV